MNLQCILKLGEDANASKVLANIQKLMYYGNCRLIWSYEYCFTKKQPYFDKLSKKNNPLKSFFSQHFEGNFGKNINRLSLIYAILPLF